MKLKITVHGVAYEVDVEILDAEGEFSRPASPRLAPATPSAGSVPVSRPAPSQPAVTPPPAAAPHPGSNAVTSPIAGTVHEIKCKVGDSVGADQVVMVIEAMKMNTSIAAPAGGKVSRVAVAVGDNVREGQILVEFD